MDFRRNSNRILYYGEENGGLSMMSYIQELRKVIGSQAIITVGATIMVYNDKGEILLHRRSDTGIWGIPGGAMAPGETIEQTARRELYEGTGLEAEELRLKSVLTGPEYFFAYPNGEQVHTVIVLYEAIGARGDLLIRENRELKYFPLNELPRLESRAAGIFSQLGA